MIALIAEKPSVAKDIARIIGATERNDGYLSGNGYMVTWAFGHLIQLAMPRSLRRGELPQGEPAHTAARFPANPSSGESRERLQGRPRRAETVESDKGSVR